MSLFKSIHRSSFWSVAFTSAACLLGASQAPAADPGATRSVTVSYRDLNLSTIEGATALYQVAKVNSPLLTSVYGGKNKESTVTAMSSK